MADGLRVDVDCSLCCGSICRSDARIYAWGLSAQPCPFTAATLSIQCSCARKARWEGEYCRRERALCARDAVFEKVGVLQAGELYRDAVLEMAHDPAGGPANGDGRSQLGALLGRDRRTRLGEVDDAAGQVDPVRQDEPGRGIT